MKDLFDRVYNDKGPIGNWATRSEGYYVFPKLEGPISNHMIFNGKEIITWLPQNSASDQASIIMLSLLNFQAL